MVEAKETTTSAGQKPKRAPPARVITAAPGRERAVTAT
jgi:hypothetical protein